MPAGPEVTFEFDMALELCDAREVLFQAVHWIEKQKFMSRIAAPSGPLHPWPSRSFGAGSGHHPFSAR